MDKATEEVIDYRAQIRDQFAMRIMAALMTHSDFSETETHEARLFDEEDFKAEAMIAYKAAAAMMRVRAEWISNDCQMLGGDKE